jgi:hypothetical protein
MEHVKKIATKRNSIIFVGLIIIAVIVLLLLTKAVGIKDQPTLRTSFTADELKALPSPPPPPELPSNAGANLTAYKNYTNQKAGVSFDYPSSWDLIESYGLPEGTGISPLEIIFTENKSDDSAKEFNDISINMVVRFNAAVQSYDDLYNSMLESFNGAKSESYTIDGLDGTKYYDIGGMASNPYTHLVKQSDKFFFALENQNSEGMLAKQVSKEVTEKILSSIKFTK